MFNSWSVMDGRIVRLVLIANTRVLRCGNRRRHCILPLGNPRRRTHPSVAPHEDRCRAGHRAVNDFGRCSVLRSQCIYALVLARCHRRFGNEFRAVARATRSCSCRSRNHHRTHHVKNWHVQGVARSWCCAGLSWIHHGITSRFNARVSISCNDRVILYWRRNGRPLPHQHACCTKRC